MVKITYSKQGHVFLLQNLYLNEDGINGTSGIIDVTMYRKRDKWFLSFFMKTRIFEFIGFLFMVKYAF